MKVAELVVNKQINDTTDLVNAIEKIKQLPETKNLENSFHHFIDKIQNMYDVEALFRMVSHEFLSYVMLYLKIMIFVFIVYTLVGAFSKSILYRKAGKSGIRAFIPFVSLWTMTKIAGLPGTVMFLRFLIFIPIVGPIIAIMTDYYTKFKFAKSYGKKDLFSLFVIVMPLLGYLIMAIGKIEYTGKYYNENLESDIVKQENKSSDNVDSIQVVSNEVEGKVEEDFIDKTNNK